VPHSLYHTIPYRRQQDYSAFRMHADVALDALLPPRESRAELVVSNIDLAHVEVAGEMLLGAVTIEACRVVVDPAVLLQAHAAMRCVSSADPEVGSEL
jgi:hypothetical protein